MLFLHFLDQLVIFHKLMKFALIIIDDLHLEGSFINSVKIILQFLLKRLSIGSCITELLYGHNVANWIDYGVIFLYLFENRVVVGSPVQPKNKKDKH